MRTQIHSPRGIAQEDFLPPSCLKILGVLMAFREHGVTPSLRDIAGECGWTNLGMIEPYLRRLRSMGLIDFANKKARTTRPRCRVVAGPNGAIPRSDQPPEKEVEPIP